MGKLQEKKGKKVVNKKLENKKWVIARRDNRIYYCNQRYYNKSRHRYSKVLGIKYRNLLKIWKWSKIVILAQI